MALHLHRSNRVESLVEMLCAQLTASWPDDPFQRVPIVVGSSGMERFLRHEIATRTGIAAGLAFPFPRPALAGAARWLLAGATESQAEFWELDDAQQQDAARFEREGIAFRLIGELRSRAADPAFVRVERYLAEGTASQEAGRPVTARELTFAREVGDVLDRLMHDRPVDALAWARDPSIVDPQHVWLATLLRQLGVADDAASPARNFESLCAKAIPDTGRALCVFGLSTLGPGDRERLAQIARGVDVHLFVLVPTREWIGDQRTPGEYRGAVRSAKTAEAVAQIESDQQHANPTIAALGSPSRDLQTWFEETGYQRDDQVFDVSDDAAPTLLGQIQRWMLLAEGLNDVAGPWQLDRSVQFHATYGALRQCEVLRDQLLMLFAQDKTLEPRDVLVMTPDIETYASLVAAVFARRGATPAIATSVADLGLSRTNPMAEVMFALLELAAERVTATRVSSLLSLGPVRARFGIVDEQAGELQELLRKSGLRWGLDADDRARVNQPRRDQNTVRFAAERVALGVLMPDEDPLGVVSGDTAELGPAVPLDAIGSEAVDRAGALLGLLSAVRVHRTALAGPLSAKEWRQRLLLALDAVAATPDATAWLRAEVASALDQFVTHASPLADLPVERDAVRKWLVGGFEIAQRGDRPITGAVTVCALQPMRSVPFRVVALLGMDDGAFPRGGHRANWDPFEQRRAGERDGREIDRHLLLEAILSAREHLIFLWSGHEIQTGKDQAAAVPVEELLETLATLTKHSRASLVREHPLQPWSEKNFLPQSATYDVKLAEAATLRRQLRTTMGSTPSTSATGLFGLRTALVPAETEPLREITIGDLVNALYKPQKYFLRQRLGLWLETKETSIEDREPLELGAMERDYATTQRVFDALSEPGVDATVEVGAVVERNEKRLAGQGDLPLRAGGRKVFAVHQRRACALLDNAADVAGVRTEPMALSWKSTAGVSLVGHVADVRDHNGRLLLQWPNVVGSDGAHALLSAWLHLLVAAASGHAVAGARVVDADDEAGTKGAGGVFVALPQDVATPQSYASEVLDDLVSVLSRARRTALPLFRSASPAAARELLAAQSKQPAIGAFVKLRDAIDKAWEGGDFGPPGDRNDAWVDAVFGDYSPTDDLGSQADGFIDLAKRVWLPAYRAKVGSVAVAAEFTRARTTADDAEGEDSE